MYTNSAKWKACGWLFLSCGFLMPAGTNVGKKWALYWETNTCFFRFMKLKLESEHTKNAESESLRVKMWASNNHTIGLDRWKYESENYKATESESVKEGKWQKCSRNWKCDVGPQREDREQMWVKRELRLGIKHPLNWSCQIKVWKWEWKWQN